MPYRVVFAGDEKRELYVEADRLIYDKSTAPLLRLMKGSKVAAYIPVANVLYIEGTEPQD